MFKLICVSFGRVAYAANLARLDDRIPKLKTTIFNIYEDPKKGSQLIGELNFGPVFSNDSDLRGFQHGDTADLLRPLRHKDEFNEDLL